MKPNALLRLAAIGTALALLASLGCAPLPTSPRVATSDAARAGVGASSDLSKAYPEGHALAQIMPEDPELETVVVDDMTGDVGGHVAGPKVSLDVPPGAFHGSGRVKVTVPDPSVHRCALEISGTPNHFDVPVKLTFDCSDFTPDEIKRAGVMWFDPQRNRWVQVDTQQDVAHKTVGADLHHFSQYKVDRPTQGKASW